MVNIYTHCNDYGQSMCEMINLTILHGNPWVNLATIKFHYTETIKQQLTKHGNDAKHLIKGVYHFATNIIKISTNQG